MEGKCLGHQDSVKDGGGHSGTNIMKLGRCNTLTEWTALCSTIGIIRDYFQLLKKHLDKEGYTERDLNNCDESIVHLNQCTQRVVMPQKNETCSL